MTTTVALIGANGHGRWHRRRIAELQAGGAVKLVGLADPQPIEPPSDVPAFADHRELLARTRPDVVVICTPPHTHLPIALDALAAGCDLLLEKPPVTSRAAHETLQAALRAAGRSCQVGFQALGSVAWQRFRGSLPAVTGLTAAAPPTAAGSRTAAGSPTGPGSRTAAGSPTEPGTPTAVASLTAPASLTAVASWQRDDSYYARSPWAGRRTVGGRPVVDGALVNPLAHAVMQALAAGAAAGAGPPRQVEVERYRVRPIDVEDTAFARITFAGGLPLMVAVTLAGEEFIAGEIEARGPGGRALLEYPTDQLALPGSPLVEVPGRTDLLTDLLRHRAEGTPLLVPLAATADFTVLLEALTGPDIPPPHLLGPDTVVVDGPNRTIPGINALLRRSASTLALPSESDIPWATTPYRWKLPVT